MTIGISKERLKEIAKQTHDSYDTNHIVLSMFDFLIRECKELNPWLPIEENTPKDRNIWLFSNGNKYIGNWEYGGIGDGLGYWNAIPFNIKIKPTHWCELPDDPKE